MNVIGQCFMDTLYALVYIATFVAVLVLGAALAIPFFVYCVIRKWLKGTA